MLFHAREPLALDLGDEPQVVLHAAGGLERGDRDTIGRGTIGGELLRGENIFVPLLRAAPEERDEAELERSLAPAGLLAGEAQPLGLRVGNDIGRHIGREQMPSAPTFECAKKKCVSLSTAK